MDCLVIVHFFYIRHKNIFRIKALISLITRFHMFVSEKLQICRFLKEVIDMSEWDKVVLSKTVLSNFCPKQANKWIGAHMASLFLLFIAFLTWPNLTGSNRPLSLFFHHLTLPGYPVFCCLFSEIRKMEIKRIWYQLLNFLLLA